MGIDHLPDGLVNLLHIGAGADDVDAGFKALFHFFFEFPEITGQLAAVDGPFDQDQNLVKIEGLGNLIEGAVFHGTDGVAHGVLGRHENHRGIDTGFLDFFQQG